MIEETTSQLLDTRQSQSELMGALEGRSEELEQQMARCRDLEERLKEEVERKDYLALELHKAEGLIEGYESERDTLDQRIQELEEQKETLVLELETMRNKLLDLTSTQTENEQLKKELHDQQEILSRNVGEEAQALILEVSRLNSENREKDQQIKQVHERFESRVRELETSGEDTEHHFTKLLDDKKQEVMDLKLQVDALEKQVKSKKQFIEEQSSEREQEREDYQTELDKWKKLVHDLEKQNGNGSRLQREVDDLNEQLQNRIDLHNEALLEAERHQRETRDRDLSIQELKSIIQQLEAEVQERTSQAESDKQKLKKLEEELSRRPYPDDDTSDSVKSDSMEMKTAASLEMERAADDKHARLQAQLTVEEELREAAKKSKEELVREKHVLQTQLNESLVQISALRNQLDEMRHRKDFTDTADAVRRLETEREKSEEKDKEISDLKLKVEQLGETVDNRDQQIAQLKDRSKLTRGTPLDGYEYESDKEIEKQMDMLRTENKQLKAKLSLSQPVVTDMSGLSQSLIEEKNQEIDQLAGEVQRLQAEYTELRAERGVENMYLELEQLRDEVKVKEKELADLQSVRVSQSFTDHSLTPDSSLLNVGASFSEKASIQQEMEESETARIEKMTNLEAEVQTLKSALQTMEEENSGLKEKVKEQAAELEKEDVGMLQDMIQEKEELITQLTVQVDSLQAEVDNLSDFQNKLQEDFDTVQTMLEEKDKEIENLTKELTDRSPESTGEDHNLVIKHEVEIAKLKKDLREKDNVVEEKLEELAELTDKIELLESHIQKYRDQEKIYDEQLVEKDKEIRTLKKEAKSDSQALIQEQKEEIENLKENLQKVLGRPPSPPLSEDEKITLIKQQKVEIESLKTQMEAVSLGRPPTPPDESDKSDVIKRLREEIGKLRQQIMDSNLSEDDKSVLIRELRLENETLKRQIDAALKIRPPSPPRDEEETAEIIEEQKKEIEELKVRLENVMKIEPPSPPRSEDEKSVLIRKQEKEITKLKKQVEEALQISPPPLPLSEDEKDQIIEQKETEVELLKSELSKVSGAVKSGEQGKLIQEKVEEVVKLQTELNDVKRKLSESSQGSIQEKEEQIREREEQLKVASEKVKKLEEELQSAKEVRAYEEEIQLKEKEDEIEELQAELESYRMRGEGSFTQSIDLEGSLSESGSPKHLVRSMSFYKEQYEEKCSENRQLQVSNDLLKEQLEQSRSQKLEDSPEEIDLYKAEIERKVEHKVEELIKEKETLTKELTEVKQKLSQSSDERIIALEKEVQLAKEEAARERMDSIQAINDLETLRDRKEQQRRGSLKYVHELESDLEQKHVKEKQLNLQVKQLTEELTQIKRQYGIEDKPGSTASGRSSESRLQSQGSFELGTDVDTLQQQVLQFKQTADKAKEILSEKQKYQSQVVKLEIQQENLQKQMKKEVSQLEEELKMYRTKSDQDVGVQLHATQAKLEKTTEQLIETTDRLQETERNMQKISEDLKETQQDLWKTSGQLALTSGKLQETEEKLKLTISQVSEREDQIHQLQSELQHTQQEIEQETKKTKTDKPEEVQKLKEKLQTTEEELEAVKMSLKEAVEMSEQQLQMGENKDKEFVKLKLDIQKSITSKDKTIKEQKKELKEKEQEVTTLKENIKRLEQQASSGQTDEQAASVSALKAQLQNQEEVILTLESDLKESRTQVTEREKEIDDIVKRHQETKSDEADTIQAMHSQIAELQRELEELRSANKALGERARSQGSREESPYDQNGRAGVGDGSHRPETRRPHGESDRDTSRRQDGGKGDYTQGYDRSFEDDSGHQSFDPQSRGRSPQYTPDGRSPSPRQQYGADGEGQVHQNVQPGNGSSRGNGIQTGPRDGQSSYHETEDNVNVNNDRYDVAQSYHQRDSQGSTSQYGEQPTVQRPSSGRAGGESQRHVASDRESNIFEESERYISENGQLFDRDGNLRPRYTHAAEGQGHMAGGDTREQYMQGQSRDKHFDQRSGDGFDQSHIVNGADGRVQKSGQQQIDRGQPEYDERSDRDESPRMHRPEGHCRGDRGQSQYEDWTEGDQMDGRKSNRQKSDRPGCRQSSDKNQSEYDERSERGQRGEGGVSDRRMHRPEGQHVGERGQPQYDDRDQQHWRRDEDQRGRRSEDQSSVLSGRSSRGQRSQYGDADHKSQPSQSSCSDRRSGRSEHGHDSQNGQRRQVLDERRGGDQGEQRNGGRSPRGQGQNVYEDNDQDQVLDEVYYSRTGDNQAVRDGQDSRPQRGQQYDQGDQLSRVERGDGDRFPGEGYRQGDQGQKIMNGHVGEGMSSEAERCIQQLRKELLITKTALMQIQRGGSLEPEQFTGDLETEQLVQEVMSQGSGRRFEMLPRDEQGRQGRAASSERQQRHRSDVQYETIPDEQELHRVKKQLEKTEDELELYRTSTNLTAHEFVQKVMNLKDELSTEHQRHVQELTLRAQQDTETQLATMRIKYTDEIEHIRRTHVKELEEKQRDLQQRLERSHKGEMNRLILRHQEEVGALRSRNGVPLDDVSQDFGRRPDGAGPDGARLVNGHGSEPMSSKLQGILRRLNREGVEVLTISELEYLSRRQSQSDLPDNADPESLKTGWENERQSLLSTIQSLKDLLAQTHRLQGMDKDDDNDDDYYSTMEGSDWRAELLRSIGYVFSREREALLAELRSHVLAFPNANSDELQRLEQKIRNQEAHQHSALDQIFNADRQSMLAEVRDLRAHATIARMHNQEERDRLSEKVTNAEDQAIKKERQLKKQVQLLEFKIQQEKLLQEDLKTSLDSERTRTGDLSSQLNQEKVTNLDLQATLTSLQVQVGKLKENLEREQSRYVSVTLMWNSLVNALEEEKSKSLNLSEVLESEREALWRVQAELEALKQQQALADPRAIQELERELRAERESRCQAESQHEIDCVTLNNLKQEMEMERRHQVAKESEMGVKVTQLQKMADTEKKRAAELELALERERSLNARLHRNLEAAEANGVERACVHDLQVQLDTERAKVDDLERALQREQEVQEEMVASVETETAVLKENLQQEREVNKNLKHEVDKLQFERLEAVNKLQKEREMIQRVKAEREQMNEELRRLKTLETQRDQDREAEKLAERKTLRQADREKDDIRLKMHEYELEVQRLTQKVLGLEDQLAESQENELKAIREQEKLRNMQPIEQPVDVVSVQTSPRRDMDDGTLAERRERLQVYRSQLESMCQSLHFLILRCREQLNKTTHRGSTQTDVQEFESLQKSLRDLLSEIKQLQEMEGDFLSHPSGSVNERILRQNEELTNFIVRISEEKTELRSTLSNLEEEIWRYRQLDAKYQELQRSTEGSDHALMSERADWAKERLSLQMALNAAEREIDMLQTDLRIERERRVAAGITDARETDKVKIERLYGKYLRAESFRKMLIYQKKYLLVLLGGFQDTEETTLALLAQMGAVDRRRQSMRRSYSKPLTSFRSAVRVVIAITRMKYLVKKWRRATRVGSEVVGGAVDQSNGYMPQTSSYSPPRHRPSTRLSATPTRSSSSPSRSSHRHISPQRSSDPVYGLQTRADFETYSSSSYESSRPFGHVMSTPPTKDYSGTKRYSSPSSGARRKILTSATIPAPSQVRFAADDSKIGDLGETDDYIHRLESLQSRLGSLQNALIILAEQGKKSSWKQPWR